MKNFSDIHINKENRFSLGVETYSGKYFLSIPLSNKMVDYEEYYEIDKILVENYPDSINEIIKLLKRCRSRQYDDFLFYKPGSDRGIPS